MASKLSNRLCLEALEDRWNLSPLQLEQTVMTYSKVEFVPDAGLVAPSAEPVPAAFDAFLEIRGIDGETEDAAAVNKISPKLFLA
jgi:hypothetical protein